MFVTDDGFDGVTFVHVIKAVAVAKFFQRWRVHVPEIRISLLSCHRHFTILLDYAPPILGGYRCKIIC